MIVGDWVEVIPPEPKHKGKRERTWARWGLEPDRKAHKTRNGAGVVGQLRRERRGRDE